jgi:hypothetical protein
MRSFWIVSLTQSPSSLDPMGVDGGGSCNKETCMKGRDDER